MITLKRKATIKGQKIEERKMGIFQREFKKLRQRKAVCELMPVSQTELCDSKSDDSSRKRWRMISEYLISVPKMYPRQAITFKLIFTNSLEVNSKPFFSLHNQDKVTLLQRAPSNFLVSQPGQVARSQRGRGKLCVDILDIVRDMWLLLRCPSCYLAQ